MIFGTVYRYICYFDKFDKNGMYISSVTKELSISLFMCFRIFNFGQIKMILCRDKNFKFCYIANLKLYEYINLIKLIIILEQIDVLL